MDPLPILSFLVLVLALAFFAGTEIPLMSVSEHKLDSWLRQKKFGAETLAKLKKNNERLLITNLIGTLLVTSAPTIIAEKFITPELEHAFNLDPHIATTIVYVSAFLIILLFGEIASKIIGVRFSENVALRVAPIYQVLVWLFLPVTLLVEGFMWCVGKIFGGKIDFHEWHAVTEEELEAFIEMSHEGWAVEADEKKQIKNLLGLSDMTAETVMTPRVHVDFISEDKTVDEVCEFLITSTHSRFPVYADSTDHANHIITFREAFRMKSEGMGAMKLSEVDLEKIMKIPLTQPLDQLFEKFQKSRRHMALIIDEHGGTAGIITMEDILEEVFGDIKDETDREEIFMKRKSEDAIEAVGSVLIDDILEEFNIRFEDSGVPMEYKNETLSYIFMAEEEQFPEEDSTIAFTGSEWTLHITVTKTEDRVIEKVLCTYTK